MKEWLLLALRLKGLGLFPAIMVDSFGQPLGIENVILNRCTHVNTILVQELRS